MTVSQKLWSGFGALTVLLVLSSAAIILRVGRIKAQVQAMTDARDILAEANQLEANILGYSLAVRTFLQFRDAETIQDLNEHSTAVERHLGEYRRLAKAKPQQELARRIAALWSEQSQIGRNLVTAESERQRPTDEDLLRELFHVRSALTKLLDDEVQADAVTAYNACRDIVLHEGRTIVGYSLSWVAASAVISVLTGYVVGRSVIRSERIIAEQGERWRTTLASIGDGVITTDIDGKITNLNAAAELLTGWQNHEAIGRKIQAVFKPVHELTRQVVECPAIKALRDRTIVRLAHQSVLISKDGTERPIDDCAAPIRCHEGEIVGCVVVFRDISEQKQAVSARKQSEDKLRRSHDTFLTLIQNAPLGVYLVDSAFRLAQISAGCRKVFNNIDPLIGRDFAEILRIVWPEPFANEVISRFHHTLATGEPYHSPDTTEHRGNIADVESYDWQIERIMLPDGKFGVVCYFYDLTEHRQFERDAQFLADLGERIRSSDDANSLLSSTLVSIGQYFQLNRCYIAETDEAHDRWWVGQDYHGGVPTLVGEYRVSEYPPAIVNSLRAGRTLVAHDNQNDPLTAVYYEAKFAPLGIRAHVIVPLDRDGRWYGSLVAATSEPRDWQPREVRLLETVGERLWNAIEKVRLDASLRESEERFRAMADNIPQLAWMADGAGRIFWYNQQWFDYTGTTLDQMEGWGWKAVHHPHHVERVVQKIAHHFRDGLEWEDTFPLRAKNGEYRWFLSRMKPIRDDNGSVVRFFGTNTDVTEQLSTERAIQEADRRKTEFLAMLAHELRNPLAPIRNSVQILRMNCADNPNAALASELMERQVAQMARLIDDLLDVSRISRGKIELKKQTVELRSVVEQAVEAARSLVECMGHDLTPSFPAYPIYLNADPTRLAQIVGNLLNNACKFTEKGGRIRLTVEQVGDQATIRVCDTGIGIAADQLTRIFEMFAQLDTSLERSHGGLGIGLSLVKTLVEMHGGTVDAYSAGIGQGSEFVVRVPISTEMVKSAPSVDGKGTQPSRRILVVDDNRDSATSLAMLLRLVGHETHTAYDGQEAIDSAATLQPEVVLLDIGLPKLNGYEVCRRIREQPWGQMMTLIALTGWGQEDDRAKSRDAGFDAHLVKPVNLTVLTQVLAQVVPIECHDSHNP